MIQKQMAYIVLFGTAIFMLLAFAFYDIVTSVPVRVAPYRVVNEQVKALDVRLKALEVKLDSLTNK